jgi:hypothetical protein
VSACAVAMTIGHNLRNIPIPQVIGSGPDRFTITLLSKEE